MALQQTGDIGTQLVYAMRLAPTTVTVITAGNGAADVNGLTATSFCSVSLDPPSLLVCVNRDSGTNDLIRRTGRFCLNILARGQESAAVAFASPGTAQEKFDGAQEAFYELEGLPALQNAVANVACTVTNAVDAGTHTVFIGEVIQVRVRQNQEPLLYGNQCYGAFRVD